jgi:4-hydroxy-3-methylbut-2-en-1-yl diphosphate synthase IspG/GcpE
MLRLCYQADQADARKNGFWAYFMGCIVNGPGEMADAIIAKL